MVNKKPRLPFWPLILAPLLLFSPGLLTGKALYWGTPSLQFIPWWDYAWEMVRAGKLPLWNPLVGMGAPLIANYQSAIFYPPNWIYFLLDTLGGISWMAWGTSLMAALHLAWAGAGMAVLLNKLDVSRSGQAVGGLSFSLSGYLVARAGFLSITSTASWLPWILTGVLLVMKKKNSASSLLLAAALGMQFLAGHAQTAWYTVLLGAAWGVYWLIRENRSRAGVQRLAAYLRPLGWAVLSGILGLLFSAVQLLPTLQYLLVSQRAQEYGYQQAVTYSFWPWRFLSLMAPNLFGSPARGNYWGYGSYWEDAVYFGFLPLVLSLVAVASAFARGRKTPDHDQPRVKSDHNSLIWFLCSLIGISMILALGRHTPIFPFFYRWIPTFDLFQAPARLTIWAVFSWSVLAAIGVDRVEPPEGRKLYWNRLAVAGSAALAIGAGITWLLFQDVEATFIRAGAEMGFWAVGSSVILLLVPDQAQSRRVAVWKWAAVGLVAADLLYTGWGLNPLVDTDFYSREQEHLQIEERIFLDPEDEYELKFEVFFQFEDYQAARDLSELRESYLPNLHMLDNLESANNFDPLVPARYAGWMEAYQSADLAVEKNMLDHMAVQTVIIPESSGKQVLVNLTGGKSARVTFSSCPRFVGSGEESLEIIMGDKFNPDQEVLIEGGRPDSFRFECGSSKAQIEVTREEPGLLSAEVQAEESGWLVWSQVMYPGWRGYLNGDAAEIQRANYLFQALPVKSGVNQVQFRYQPKLFWTGAAVSILAWLAVGGYVLFQKGKKTDENQVP